MLSLRRARHSVLPLLLLIPACAERPVEAGATPGGHVQSGDAIACRDVFEFAVSWQVSWQNGEADATRLTAVFTGPDGSEHPVVGFRYAGDEFRARFRPVSAGRWTYRYDVEQGDRTRAHGEGSFTCSGEPRGRIATAPGNPYRWIEADGRFYYPLGLQTCHTLRGDSLGRPGIDGEDRSVGGRIIPWSEYFATYGGAGFNMFRFHQKNCSYDLFRELDRYREVEARLTDELLALANAHGLRVMFGLFGFYEDRPRPPALARMRQVLPGGSPSYWTAGDGAIVAAEKRFIEYAVARWGVYVDIWELLNERSAPDAWLEAMAAHLRAVDPARRPISTSWQRPDLAAIDIVSPHWYESEDEHVSDLRVVERAARWKQAGKPVIVGEQGNGGMNWEPASAVRMRIRLWTALFHDIGIIFWETTGSKNAVFGGVYNPEGAAANIYLGPRERGYTSVLQQFSARLHPAARATPLSLSHPDRVRGWALRWDGGLAAYLHHHVDHRAEAAGTTVGVEVPAVAGSDRVHGEWIDPATGRVLARVVTRPGPQTLPVPSFRIDMALVLGVAP